MARAALELRMHAMSLRTRALAVALAAAFARFALVWPLAQVWPLARAVVAISDDDFARVTIAQRFAVAPHLDPSGTSWLPAQFWALGSAGALFGRSWESMHLASIAMGMAAAAYLGFVLHLAFPRGPTAWVASVAPLLATWATWTGACTVPEGYTGLLSTAALVALAEPRYPWHAALALGVAALSRYEVWPVVAVVAALGWRYKRGPWATAGVLAPLGWMAWNAHAHGDALHFLARVATYRAAHAPAEAHAGLHYPAIAALGAAWFALAIPAALLPPRSASDPFGVLRNALALGAVCTVVFLAYGDARGGAPTHHAERALIGVWAMLTVLAVAAVRNARECGTRWSHGLAMMAVVACFLQVSVEAYKIEYRALPGESRASAFAQGRALSGRSAILLRPCAYEHYAFAAGYGAPERVRVLPAAPLAAICPQVVLVGEEALRQGEPLR